MLFKNCSPNFAGFVFCWLAYSHTPILQKKEWNGKQRENRDIQTRWEWTFLNGFAKLHDLQNICVLTMDRLSIVYLPTKFFEIPIFMQAADGRPVVLMKAMLSSLSHDIGPAIRHKERFLQTNILSWRPSHKSLQVFWWEIKTYRVPWNWLDLWKISLIFKRYM